MWKNIAEPKKTQMTIWPKRILRWILKATNTHSEYMVVIAFPLQEWFHERASIFAVRTLPVWLHT